MAALGCPSFAGNNVFAKEEMMKLRVVGSEEMKADMTEHTDWDGSSRVASVLIHLDADGGISQMQPCIFGESDSKYLDATNIWEKQPQGAVLKIGSIDLALFVFRGSLVSDWLEPGKFHWSYRLPSKKTKDKFHIVDEAKLPELGASKIWVRAFLQPIPGPKLKLVLGFAPENDITSIIGYQHKAFPVFECGNTTIPIKPTDTMGMGIGLMPYFLDGREEEGDDLVMPSSWTVKTAVAGLFGEGTRPVIRRIAATWNSAKAGAASFETEPSVHRFPNPRPETDAEAEPEEGEYLGKCN